MRFRSQSFLSWCRPPCRDRMDRTIAKYRREVGLPDSNNPQFRTMEFWRSEIEELKRSINTLEARQKHLSGEDILALGMRELKQLERQLKVGVERVRSRKDCLVHESVELFAILKALLCVNRNVTGSPLKISLTEKTCHCDLDKCISRCGFRHRRHRCSGIPAADSDTSHSAIGYLYSLQ
ncbi:hypothetical protein V6N13_070615 [Hibiscus sabdariffa]